MPDRFQIEIEETGEGVSAEALRLHLEQALRFLKDDPQAPEAVSWKVTKISMNSPLLMELERSVPPGVPEPASRPGEQLARTFASLRLGEPLGEELSATRLHAVEQMAGHSNGTLRVRVRSGVGEPIDLDPAWAKTVRDIRGERRRREQWPPQPYSATGRLEGVNVHGNKSEFYVYDPLTDQKMRCIFPQDLLDRVRSALGERVEVGGITSFGPGNIPQAMHVETLRLIPSRQGSFLDRLRAAHERGGIDLTGGLSIEEAIDEVRGGDN